MTHSVLRRVLSELQAGRQASIDPIPLQDTRVKSYYLYQVLRHAQYLPYVGRIFSDLKAYLSGVFGGSTAGNSIGTRLPRTQENPTPRILMDPDNSDTLLLPDGRKLGYAQFGSPTGRAVFFTHGHPGSRFEGAHLHDLGLKLGARIICPERPGMGLSSPQPGRTLLDYPKDVEHLADHLKLESYGVLGVSGGGPYALACAYALPRDKLKCVSIVCGLGPVYEIGMKGARWLNWIGFAFGYRYTPAFINRWFWQSQTCGRLDLSDEERLQRHMKEFSKPKSVADQKDFEAMTNEVNARRFLRSTRGAFAQGYDGALQDGRVLSTDFGFRIQDIRPDLPVQLWYGKLDVNVPLNHGETIAKRLGDRAILRVENETHASIFFNWRERFLGDMVRQI